MCTYSVGCVYIQTCVWTYYRLATHFQGSHSNTTLALRLIQLAWCVHSRPALIAASMVQNLPIVTSQVPSHVSTSHEVVQSHGKHWYCVLVNGHETLVSVPSCGGNVERMGKKSDTSYARQRQLSHVFLLRQAELFGHYADVCLHSLPVSPSFA